MRTIFQAKFECKPCLNNRKTLRIIPDKRYQNRTRKLHKPEKKLITLTCPPFGFKIRLIQEQQQQKQQQISRS